MLRKDKKNNMEKKRLKECKRGTKRESMAGLLKEE